MARVKRGVTAHKRHKRLLEDAEGRKGTRSRLVKPAREALLHALAYATRDRKQRKREFRGLWIIRINAATRAHRPAVRSVHRGPQGGRRRAGPQDPRRHRRPGRRDVRSDRRGRQGRLTRPAFAVRPRTARPSTSDRRSRARDSRRPDAVPSAPSEPAQGTPMDLAQLTRDLEDLRDGGPGPGRRRTGQRRARAARGGGPGQEGSADRRTPRHRRPAGRRPAARGRRGQRGPGGDRRRPGGPAAARSRGAELADAPRRERVDVTTPGRPIRRGPLHPSIEAMNDIARIFSQFGFVVHESPEIEDDLTNFQMLNIPPDHPARDLWDTLYVDLPGTCSGPTRRPARSGSCRRCSPPIRALLPGRCFRYEAVDAQPRVRVLPGRGTDGGRGDHAGRPARASSTSSPTRCSAPASGRVSGPATTRSRSRRSPSTSSASCAAARAARRAGGAAG